MPSETWLLAAERGESPALLVELDLDVDGGGDLRRYISNFPVAAELTAETGDQYLPFVHSDEQDSFGIFVDPKTYEIDATAEYTVWLSSDDDLSQDEVRELVALGGWEGKEVHFFIGFAGLLRADYEPIWGGVLEDVYSEMGRVGFLVVGAQEMLRTTEVTDFGVVTREHPFQIARRLIQEDGAKLGDTLVETTDFDPDDAVNVDIGHWGVVRAIHGGLTGGDRRVRDGEKVSALLNELSMHTTYAWVPFENGKIKPVDMSPGGTIGDIIVEGRDFAPADFDQGTTTENLVTRFTALFSWRGSQGNVSGGRRNDPGSYESGRESIDRQPIEFFNRFTRSNDTEAARWAHDNAAARRRFKDETLEMKWVGALTHLDASINNTAGADDTFQTSGGHLASFAGRRKNGVEAGNWPLTATRLAHFMIVSAAGTEIFSVKAAAEDTDVAFFDAADTLETGDSIPFNEFAFVTWTINARALFGTSNPGVPHPAGAQVFDITLAVHAINNGINRFGRGAPIVTIKNLSLAHAFRPIGSVMGIVTDQYLAQATNGSDGTIAFKVIGKSVSLNDGVELLFVRDTTNVPISDVVVVGKRKWWGGPELNRDAFIKNIFMDNLSTGVSPLSSSTLDFTIGAATFKTGSVFADTLARTITVDDDKDTYVFFDAERLAFIRHTVATGAPQPLTSIPFLYVVGKAVAGGGSITSTEDLQEKVGLLGRLTKGFPGPSETTLPDPTSNSFDEPGQFIRVVDRQYRRFDETLSEVIIGHLVGPSTDHALYELNETVIAAIADASPDSNDAITVNIVNGDLGKTPLIADGGTAITLAAESARIQYTGLSAGPFSRIIVSMWFNANDQADDQFLFAMADSVASQVEFAVFFRDSDDELAVTLNGSTVTSNLKGDLKPDLLDGETHFLVAQFLADGTTNPIEIWIDGHQVFSQTGNVASANWIPDQILFGCFGDGFFVRDSLEGTIDKCWFVCDKSALLTQAEILEIYHRGLQEHVDFERVNFKQAGVGPTMRAGTDPASSHVNSATTTVIFNHTEWDDFNALDPATGGWTAPFDCIVHASTVVQLGTTSGQRVLEFQIDGVLAARVFDATVTSSLEMNGDATLRMRAGEELTVATFHNTGGTRTTSTNIARTHLTVFVLLELGA